MTGNWTENWLEIICPKCKGVIAKVSRTTELFNSIVRIKCMKCGIYASDMISIEQAEQKLKDIQQYLWDQGIRYELKLSNDRLFCINHPNRYATAHIRGVYICEECQDEFMSKLMSQL